MSFLICRFASPRSRPEQIRDWIDYLGELRRQHQFDADRIQLIDRLEAQAQSWLHAALGRPAPRFDAQGAGMAGVAGS